MKNILAENLLRFNAKNLTLENKSSMLTEQTEPDLSAYDWSKGGSVTWDNAKVSDIIKYIMARDANQQYQQFEVYAPIFNWFEDNGTAPYIKDSLLIWCGDDPYYGLAAARSKAAASGTQYAASGAEKNDDVLQRAKEWSDLISTLKGTSSEDKQVAANMKLIATAFQKAGDAGLNINLSVGNPSSFKTGYTKYPDFKYLPTGGYTTKDIATSKAIATSIINTLSTSAKQTSVSQDSNLNLVKADNITRTKLLSSIDKQVQEKINNPQFRDSIGPGMDSIPYVVSKANFIQFDKASVATNVGTQEQPGSVDTVAFIEYQWPDKGTDQATADNLAANFFPDDGVETSSESKAGMNEIARKVAIELNNAKQKYADTFEIVSIAINTFASTSTVNSAYGSKTKQYNKQNNVTLVNARFASMQKDMSERLTATLANITDSTGESPARKIVNGQRQNFANAGPEWEIVGGDAFGQSYGISNYGPLFQEAYKKNPKITPKQFYSIDARRNNPAIKQDYETTYGGYRKAWIWVTLQIKGADTPDVKAEDVVIAISGKMEAIIQWPDKRKSKRVKGSKSPRGRMPANNMPQFSGRGIGCPVF